MKSKVVDFSLTKYPVAEVTWFDAQSSLEPISVKDLEDHPLLVTKSVGFLMKNDNEKVVLAFMIFGEDIMKHYQIIPKQMVKNIKLLKENKNERR